MNRLHIALFSLCHCEEARRADAAISRLKQTEGDWLRRALQGCFVSAFLAMTKETVVFALTHHGSRSTEAAA